MEEGKGPLFPKTVKTDADLDKLRVADEDSLGYVIDAIKVTKKELNGRVPLIGFAGAPWTIFCYMVEGKGSKTFSVARKILYNNPVFAHKLMDKITGSTISYLKNQISAGANIVQVFDSWAGILPGEQYDNFSLKYISKIADSITEVPVIVFAKGAYASRKSIGKINCDVVGLDWNMDIQESRNLIGPGKTLQGNLDPAVLYGDFGTIRAETRKMIDRFGRQRHIANLGHGVYPDMEADKVKCFIDEVKDYSSR